MGRGHRNPYAKSTACRYVVIWDLQWQVIEFQRVDPGSGSHTAFTQCLERLACDGWKPEGCGEFGFVFIARSGERRLVTITQRDPRNAAEQTFSPFDTRQR